MMLMGESLGLSLNLGSSLLCFLLVTVVILIIYHFWFQSLRYTKLGNKLPGIDPLPLIGNAHMILNKNPTEIMTFTLDLAQRLSPVGRVWFGHRLGVLVADPRDVELILGSNVHIEKSKEYRLFKPWLGDGLLISKGERWKSHRKMIAPTFHQSILKTFLPVFNKNGRELVERLRKEVVGQICDVHDYMSAATVDVLLETVMGVKKSTEEKFSHKYVKAVMDMCAILHFRHVRLWMQPDFIFRWTKLFQDQIKHLSIIHRLTDNVIKAKKYEYFRREKQGDVSLYSQAVKETEEELKSEPSTGGISFGSALRDDLDNEDESVGQKKRLAFLDFMIEANETEGVKLNDTDIRDEVSTLMFEGHDTTAAGTSFFLCMLGVHQDVQERVYQEVKEVMQDTDKPITFSDVVEMKYLERVLLETLRLYPPVPIIARVLREDVQLASADYIIPEGATVAIPQFLIHRDPKHYPNPTKFDPDNFLPEKCQQRHYYSYIPFSAGPRSCVGRKYAMLKMKILLAYIVRNFFVKSVVDEKDFQLQGDIILKRSDGFRIILEERT